MKKTVLETVVERSKNFEASLKTLAYSMEAMNDIDNGEKELREIGWNIASQIECLQEYHAKTLQLMEQLKSNQGEAEEQTEIKGKMLTKAEAEELFDRNAVLLDYTCNAVPFYKVIEIFGEEAAAFLEGNMKHNGYISFGRDYSGYGTGVNTDDYLYKCGFLKVVTDHNNRIAIKVHEQSEGGHIWDRYWEERSRRMDEAEAEEARKRAERKAKRDARKAANLAKQNEKGD